MGVIGCGDVAHRRYLPVIESARGLVELAGLCDLRREAVERTSRLVAPWASVVPAFTDLGAMLRDLALDAVFNLTPAPLHARVSQACLEAGVHVYSEKPIASTLADADRLVQTAHNGGPLLLCAPANAATRRIAWLSEIVSSGRYGRLTLGVAQYADPGPAAWREYTGDPAVFYGPEVGPVHDHGVYRLHALTTLMGPVRLVQAMGTIAVPHRRVRAGRRAGQVVEVTAPDHVLMNLEFSSGALGQLLSSSAAVASLAPWLELHFERATLSFHEDQYDKDSAASLYLDDETSLGIQGWLHGVRPPPPPEPMPTVETGAMHFIECLRGEARPLLSAEQARHVLDVILKAYRSIADGKAHETETTF